MKKYIIENVNFFEEEKLGFSLKYQILNKETSLFEEIELFDKISEEMIIKIIGKKENKILIKKRKRRYYRSDVLVHLLDLLVLFIVLTKKDQDFHLIFQIYLNL